MTQIYPWYLAEQNSAEAARKECAESRAEQHALICADPLWLWKNSTELAQNYVLRCFFHCLLFCAARCHGYRDFKVKILALFNGLHYSATEIIIWSRLKCTRISSHEKISTNFSAIEISTWRMHPDLRAYSLSTAILWNVGGVTAFLYQRQLGWSC